MILSYFLIGLIFTIFWMRYTHDWNDSKEIFLCFVLWPIVIFILILGFAYRKNIFNFRKTVFRYMIKKFNNNS